MHLSIHQSIYYLAIYIYIHHKPKIAYWYTNKTSVFWFLTWVGDQMLQADCSPVINCVSPLWFMACLDWQPHRCWSDAHCRKRPLKTVDRLVVSTLIHKWQSRKCPESRTSTGQSQGRPGVGNRESIATPVLISFACDPWGTGCPPTQYFKGVSAKSRPLWKSRMSKLHCRTVGHRPKITKWEVSQSRRVQGTQRDKIFTKNRQDLAVRPLQSSTQSWTQLSVDPNSETWPWESRTRRGLRQTLQNHTWKGAQGTHYGNIPMIQQKIWTSQI